MQNNLIYTLGTDLRSSEDFIEIIFAYNIMAFIDVRSFPQSKLQHFNRNTLSELLLSNGIEYYFVGRELGGFRKGGYTAYTVTEEFLKSIEMLEKIARAKISVIACAERFPCKCHRKWISKELQQRGWHVQHIIDKGKLWIPK